MNVDGYIYVYEPVSTCINGVRKIWLAGTCFLESSSRQRNWTCPQVSSIGRLLFNRPVDRSQSISTVDGDSPTWKYVRYRRSIRIHLIENTVDIWSTVDFTQKSVEIDRRYGFIPKKIGRPSISTVEVDMDSKKSGTLTSPTNKEIMMFIRKPIGRSMMISSTHPYFITNRCK